MIAQRQSLYEDRWEHSHSSRQSPRPVSVDLELAGGLRGIR